MAKKAVKKPKARPSELLGTVRSDVALRPRIDMLRAQRMVKNREAARAELARMAQKRAQEAVLFGLPLDSPDLPKAPRGSRYARRDILQATLAASGLDLTELLTTCRAPAVASWRQAAAHVMRTRTTISFPEMGKVLNRDHTTMMYAVRVVERRWDAFAPLVGAIEKELGL
jgi:chromosomal replication initiation ATPase DnaA